METTTLILKNTINTGCYMRLANEVVEAATIKEKTISGALVTYVLFEDCHFINCTFYATSFEDCLFKDCVFENCSFVFGGIRNCIFQSSTFLDCRFQLGGIYGNDFSICKFSSTGHDFMGAYSNRLNYCTFQLNNFNINQIAAA